MIEVEQGTFAPLAFVTDGGVGREFDLFLKNLVNKLAQKQNEKYEVVVTWIRTKLCFEIVKFTLLFMRGSRAPFRNMIENNMENFSLNTSNGGFLG